MINSNHTSRISVLAAVRSTALAALAALLLTGCGGVSDSAPSGEFVAPVVEWRLVFEDNFDGDSLDTSNWTALTGNGCPDLCGWGNNELQQYGEDNVSVSNGMLQIEGRQELDGSYTSARLTTVGKFDFRYGRVEVSARLPEGQGIWPAIWMLHSDPSIYGAWPASGEIDIVEGFNLGVDGNNTVHSTTHYGLPTFGYTGTGSSYDLGSSAGTAFREYAVEWERDQIRFFIDGVHHQTQRSDEWYVWYPANEDGVHDPIGAYRLGSRDAPFDQMFHLIMNLAIGGNPVGAPDAGTMFPSIMEVDYVRVYECVNANPDTGRGCGTGDVTVPSLSEGDGGPLEGEEIGQPFNERLDLYVNGPETIELSVGDQSGSNTLSVDGFTGDGDTVVSEPSTVDPDDPENTVWRIQISGNASNVYLTSQDLSDDPLLDTGFDFSGNRGAGLGRDPFGELAFDMRVNSLDENARILVKLDSGFPHLGEVELSRDQIDASGAWKTYSVKFSEFIASPGFVDCCGGTGVDLANILNPFVFEVQGGSVDVYVDNIYVTNACKVVGGCGVDLKANLPDLVVFDDEVNTAVWSNGIVGSDSGTGFNDYTNATDPGNKANWAIVTDDDPERGEVIEVTFNDSDAFGVWFAQSAQAVDVTAYAAGALTFDIIVTDYGTNTTGMTMKVDCFFPCTSGDQNLGVIADGVWETVTVPTGRLAAGGLDLTMVNTGAVIFPTAPQSGGITFRLDNIRWVAATDAPSLDQVDLPVSFDDEFTDYSLTDFGGAVSLLADDPTGAVGQVVSTTKTAGAETWAGTVLGPFANPIPFAADATTMNVRVYSPSAGVPVLLKVETADPDVFAEVLVMTTAENEWEALEFDFSTVGIDVAQSYDRAIVFFDFGNSGVEATYFWDDLGFGVAPPQGPPFVLPVGFESETMLIDFGNASSMIVADPAGGNNQVVQTTKPEGAEVWAGTVIGDGTGFTMPIPFAEGSTIMSARVYAPAVGTPFLFKVEAADPDLFAEVQVETTVANAWETLIFDFSTVDIDLDVTYVQAIMFPNFGSPGDGSTYYWDDVIFGVPFNPPVTFDDPTQNYMLIDFGRASSMLVADPDNAANMVAQSTKPAGAETWAGTVIGSGSGFSSPIAISADAPLMSVRVRPPGPGIPVLFKIEAANPDIFTEVMTMTTATDAWETLVFDFSTVETDFSATFVQAVIFFNFGTAGDDSTYYWDDVRLGGGQ